MPRVAPIQTNFTAGELSPRLEGRVDLARYQNGLRLLENMVIHPHGGASRRPGTRYVAEVRDSEKAVRLIPFQFSAEQAYVLEFGDTYIRFYKDRGRITVTGTSAAITNGSFASGTSGWTDASTSPGAVSHDSTHQRLRLTAAASAPAIARQQVSCTSGALHVLCLRVTEGPVRIRIGSTAGGADHLAARECGTGWHSLEFTPTGSSFWLDIVNDYGVVVRSVDDVAIHADGPLELPTPYSVAALASLKYVQSADVMYLAQGDGPLHKLARFGHSSWSLAQVECRDGPYLAENNDTDRTLTPSGTAKGATVTLTAAGFEPFVDTDVGRVVRLKHDAKWGWARITAVSSSTVVSALVMEAFNGAGATSGWRFGAWSAATGWPRAATFFEQRLFLGGSASQPQTLWASVSGDYENFAPTRAEDVSPYDHVVADDSALTYTIASDQVNTIRWLAPARDLLVGTIGGEFRLGGGNGSPLTPTSVQVRRETTYGCADLQPHRVGASVLFLQRGERKLRELSYSFEVDGYLAPDLTLLAEHIGEGGIVDLAYQQDPDSVLWAVRVDGTLLGMTYEKAQDVIAWHRHVGDGAVERIAVVHDWQTQRDELWLCVRRTVQGATRRYIEFLESDRFATAADCFAVDCGLTYQGPATANLGGLQHLAGCSVAVLADGAVHPSVVVAEDGSIALQRAASVVHAGLAYVSALETLRLEAGAADGTAQGKAKRIHRLGIRVYRSLGVAVGAPGGILDTIPFRSSGMPMDQPPALFSGDVDVEFPGGFDSEGRIRLEQRQPLPLSVLALMPRLATFDGG